MFLHPQLDHGYLDLYIETFESQDANSTNAPIVGKNAHHLSAMGCVGGGSSRSIVAAQEYAMWVAAAFHKLCLIAEPVSRTSHMQHFRITPFSLGAAVDAEGSVFDCENEVDDNHHSPAAALGLTRAEDLAAKICTFIERCAYNWSALGNPTCAAIQDFVASCVMRYKVVSVVLDSTGRCFLESTQLGVLRDVLLRDGGLLSQVKGASALATSASIPSVSILKHRHAGPDTSSSISPLGSTDAAPSYCWRVELTAIASAPVVRERCLRLGYPAFQEYLFKNDAESDAADGIRSIDLHLRPQCSPRPYQFAAVASVVSMASSSTPNNSNHNTAVAPHGKPGDVIAGDRQQRCRSGIIVLPCGAGKTLVGVMCAAAVRKRTLIVCAGSVSVAQWKNQLLEFASLGTTPTTASAATSGLPNRKGLSSSSSTNPNVQRVACVTGKQKDPIDPEVTDVVITTYNMLSVAQKLLNRLRTAMEERREGAVRGQGRRATAAESDEEDNEAAARVAEMTGLDELLRFHGPRLSNHARTKLEFFRPFGLVLLDEVHVVPAEYFKESLSCLRARALVGLTATFVREDNRINDLYHIVGPKLYDVPWQELAEQRYLARVMCVEVHVPMTAEFAIEYLSKRAALMYKEDQRQIKQHAKRNPAIDVDTNNNSRYSSVTDSLSSSSPLLVSLAASNPNKIMAVLELVAAHRDDKVLVFCDHLELLRLYARLLRCPVVCGETSHKDRLMIFSDFQAGGGGGAGSVICISRVGDVSVNLPSASVVIQVSSHGGSRRQEGQRLGRILRPKPAASNGAGGTWIGNKMASSTATSTAPKAKGERDPKGEVGVKDEGGRRAPNSSVLDQADTTLASCGPASRMRWRGAALSPSATDKNR